MDEPLGAPLGVWIGALILALVGGVVLRLGLDPYFDETHLAHYRAQLSVIRDFRAEEPDGSVVLLVGNSRLGRAYDEERMSRRLRGFSAILPIWVGGIHRTFLGLGPALDVLMEARPELVVLQLSFPLRERSEAHFHRTWRRYLWHFLDGGGTWVPFRRAFVAAPGPGCPKPDPKVARAGPNWVDWYLASEGDSFELGTLGPSLDAAVAWAARVRAQGGRLALVSVPVHPAVEKYASIAEQEEAALARMAPDSLWRVPYRVSPKDFCDLTHLNEVSGRRHGRWLTGRVRHELSLGRQP